GAAGTAGGDVWWEQHTTSVRSIEPIGGATLVNVGVVPFASVTPAVLQSLAYDTMGLVANDDPTNVLVPGDVFAVRTNAGNVAKVHVRAYGYALEIEWATYRLGAAYEPLGAGYAQPEDVAVAADERTAYVTERAGNLLRVDLEGPGANRSAA